MRNRHQCRIAFSLDALRAGDEYCPHRHRTFQEVLMSAAEHFFRFSSSAPLLPAGAAVQRLAPGQVTALTASRAHLLRIDSGCAWLTFGRGPAELGGARAGDVFLCAGETLRIPASQRVVLEAARGTELRFAWQRPDAIARKVLRRAPACTAAASC